MNFFLKFYDLTRVHDTNQVQNTKFYPILYCLCEYI